VVGILEIKNTLDAWDWKAKKAKVLSIEREIERSARGRGQKVELKGKYLETGETFTTGNIRYGDFPLSITLFTLDSSYSSTYQRLKTDYPEGKNGNGIS